MAGSTFNCEVALLEKRILHMQIWPVKVYGSKMQTMDRHEGKQVLRRGVNEK